MMAWLLLLLPAARMLKFLAVAAIGLALVTVLYFLLDARAATERAKAKLATAQHEQALTLDAFARYRAFTLQAHAAERRAAESRAATKLKLKPLREITRAAQASDDGPLPRISQLFFAGLRQLQSGIVTGPGGADPGSPARTPLLRPRSPSAGLGPGGNLRVPVE